METTSAKRVLDMQYTSKSGPMVAVEMITYNHEKYIAQAIESVMMQKTDFDFKLIICEDCSTDNTAKICTEYKNKYPDKIDLHLAEKNMGVYANAKRLHELSFNSGTKYIAMLDGDDYWKDENKLQKQVDFLEAHPDYALCFHRVYEKHNGNKVRLSTLNKEKEEKTFTIDDLAKGNFIHTPSVVFRNGLFALQNKSWNIHAGDYVIHMLNASKGLIRFFPDAMAVYRRHDKGYWSLKNAVERHKMMIETVSHLLLLDFTPATRQNLNDQYVRISEEYLLLLLFHEEFDQFYIEAKAFFQEHPERSTAWIYERVPLFFRGVTESKTYRFAKRLSAVARKLRFIP